MYSVFSLSKNNYSDTANTNINEIDLAYPGAGTNVTVVIKNNGNVDAELKELILSELIKISKLDILKDFK